MTQPTLSIVILTWNSRPLLEGCLAALPVLENWPCAWRWAPGRRGSSANC